jgi:basic amino acid/polyamine antiporter, APA family
MARDGAFLPVAARIHPKYRTPAAAIIAQGVWSCVLVLTGGLRTADRVHRLRGRAVSPGSPEWRCFVLRRRYPDEPRPFRAWGYPFAPALFVGASALIVMNAVWRSPGPAGAGVIIILAGLPFFYWLQRRRTT